MYQYYTQINEDLTEKVNALMAQREHQETHQGQTMDVHAPERRLTQNPYPDQDNYIIVFSEGEGRGTAEVSTFVDNSLGDSLQLLIDKPEGPQVQDQGPSTRSKQIDQRRQDDIEILNELHLESASNVSSPPPWMSYAGEVIRIE
ncbi:hypothetical protein AYI68_g7577 [Smittium mucronatum]|uniref:Uncharacterized protein n=1 Tax=Smittium mucronatum TaxID=133383 RepID=A0A1R0GNB6_9FUNG|nr:hypothetical protein AYI68_g7577 [Smittium mucronatum]